MLRGLLCWNSRPQNCRGMIGSVYLPFRTLFRHHSLHVLFLIQSLRIAMLAVFWLSHQTIMKTSFVLANNILLSVPIPTTCITSKYIRAFPSDRTTKNIPLRGICKTTRGGRIMIESVWTWIIVWKWQVSFSFFFPFFWIFPPFFNSWEATRLNSSNSDNECIRSVHVFPHGRHRPVPSCRIRSPTALVSKNQSILVLLRTGQVLHRIVSIWRWRVWASRRE